MRTRILAALIAGSLIPAAQAAHVVDVLHSNPIDNQVTPALSTANATLGSILTTNTAIGGAVNGSADKIAAMIGESVVNQQQFASYMQQSQNLEHARQSFTVPDSICSESASGQASKVASTSVAKQGALSGGGGVSDSAISRVLSEPAAPLAQELFSTADIHGRYCTDADLKAYGATICKGSSEMPGGDTDIRSVLTGAGDADKTPDLTFSQSQVDAAMMYLKNSARINVGKKLGKGEVKTESGKQYVGMMAQYESLQSAAQQPQLAMIADSIPNEATRAALQETLSNKSGSGSSANAWYQENASPEAKKTGEMSRREFDAFEVGRRYSNTKYLEDLYAMQGDDLIRESILVQNQQNWLLLGIRDQLRNQNILQGQQLGLSSASYYGPQLQQKLQQTTAGSSR